MPTLSQTFNTTYVQKRGPKPPEYDAYANVLQAEYQEFLRRDPSEKELQRFLEQHPSLVPGAWTPGTKSGHEPLHYALITQPRLAGLRTRRPDFMWIATHSGTWFPTLIEIESPGKKIFTKSRIPSSDFTKARNQLAQWRAWFNSPSNIQLFIDFYHIPSKLRYHRTMQIHMILIYGRRDEFEADPELSKHRASLLPGADEELMSYDRLSPDPDLRDAITVRLNSAGRYNVVALPPVFSMTPVLADRLLDIDGFDKALDKAKRISIERKKFLRERLLYWKAWAASAGTTKVFTNYFRE